MSLATLHSYICGNAVKAWLSQEEEETKRKKKVERGRRKKKEENDHHLRRGRLVCIMSMVIMI